MRKILNNGEKTRQRKNKKRKKEKKEAVKAVYKHFLSHACDTTHVAPLNDPLPTPSTPPSATESGTRHNVIRTVEAMLQPTRGDGDRPKHQTWREWDGGWRAHTVERGLCGEGGERGGSRVTSRCRRRWCRQTAAPGRPARRRSWRPEPARWPRRCSAPCREAAAAGSDM